MNKYIDVFYNYIPFSNENIIPWLIHIGIALAIFLAFWISRKFLTKYIINLLSNLSKKTKTCFDNHLVEALEKPLRLFFLIFGLYLALLYLPLNPVYNVLISKVFRSLLIFLTALAFYDLAGSYTIIQNEIEHIFNINMDKILIPFFSKILRFIIAALALVIIAQEWAYDVNGFIAGLGLGGLAFALAAKDTLSNVFGGIVIITDKPFSIGDWINSPSVEGTVEDINFRSTKIRTFAQAMVTVPNATLVNEPITNWSRMGKRRINFNIGVTYSTSQEKIHHCVNEIRTMLENHPDVHPETIFVHFDAFADSSLNIFLYFFTKTTVWGEYLKIKEDVNFKIMEILEKEGVSMAFPSTSIYFENPLESK